MKGKSWHSQLTYVYPQSLIMRETDYIFYTEITQLGRRDQHWKTDSAQNCVEVCGAVPETGIQSCKILALLPEWRGCGSLRMQKEVLCALQETIWLLMTLLLSVVTTRPSPIYQRAIFILRICGCLLLIKHLSGLTQQRFLHSPTVIKNWLAVVHVKWNK